MQALAQWRAEGRRQTVHGHEVFFHVAGPEDAPVLLVLHGFPTCSFDFQAVLPRLAQHYRVVLHDHLGFGLSAKPSPEHYGYSLFEQAEIALGLWQFLGIEKGSLLAHDYGTSVTTEILARRERGQCPVTLERVTLCNGSVHIALAKLRVTQRLLKSRAIGPHFAKLASKRIFVAQMRRIFGTPGAVSDKELDAWWALLCESEGKLRMPAISQYLDERRRFHARWVGALRQLDLPTLILWGRKDPVAVPAIAEQLHADIPGSTLRWLDALGHYPMVEDPGAFADALLAETATSG